MAKDLSRPEVEKKRSSFVGAPVPIPLHEAAKEKAKKDDLTLAQVIRRLLEGYVNDDVSISSSIG